MVTIATYIIIDVLIDHPGNLLSLAGLALFIALFYVTSVNQAKVNWHPVFWGLALQFIFALLLLRTKAGFEAFNWCGDRVAEFLTYSDTGAKFIFGDAYAEHFIAFKVLPMVTFFFTMISVMYFLGAMQFIVRNIGRFLAFFMGTTPAESLNAAGNIFLSMIEAPLMIQPLLSDMTLSELHAVCTGGFASVAGASLGIYMNFGAPASHLLTASVMSAPAALAVSKITYPEIEVSKASSKDYYRMGKAKERNILEAATAGATSSMKMIGLIAVNVIAMLSVLKFLNTTLTWFGQRAGVDEFTFEFICSYALYPFAFFMGVSSKDSRKIAALIGVKTFTNEFVAYQQLGVLIGNKKNFTIYTSVMNHTDWYYRGSDIILPMVNQTLANGIVERKSEVIATYALLGFSNFGSIGIMLGALGGMIPERRSDLSRIVLRAMIAGNAACLMTGCIAGPYH
ncbi:hypothetical protein FSP39_011350 [Pinctada imbricata]|uniref:Sodium/nucleoside cotransporter n=1 Tax=Pinctada imbricata TaxID=66713 RepID=A0AA89C667_PINIB|nr:hypothetical protein FSP39_011350 [Pinctada imbricata]